MPDYRPSNLPKAALAEHALAVAAKLARSTDGTLILVQVLLW